MEAIGSEVTALAVGDLVTPLVRRAFRPSPIRADMLAFGEFVERGIYLEHGFTPPLWLDRPQYLLKVPVEMSDVAILTEPLSVVEKAVNEALILQQARLSPDTWTQRAAARHRDGPRSHRLRWRFSQRRPRMACMGLWS